jgi:hypothetical protein
MLHAYYAIHCVYRQLLMMPTTARLASMAATASFRAKQGLSVPFSMSKTLCHRFPNRQSGSAVVCIPAAAKVSESGQVDI